MRTIHRKNKFKNSERIYGGVYFQSKLEGERWIVLLDAMTRGQISKLRRQVMYELVPDQYEDVVVHLKTKDKTIRRLVEKKVCYLADFVYIKNGVEIVEDTKSERTAKESTYIIKRKLMLFRHGIRVREVYKSSEPV